MVIILVAIAMPISLHVKDKNSIFTHLHCCDEDDFLVKGKILVFHKRFRNKMDY